MKANVRLFSILAVLNIHWMGEKMEKMTDISIHWIHGEIKVTLITIRIHPLSNINIM